MVLNRFFLLNVFTGIKARGNQCCVLIVDDLSDDESLLRIASDFNLPATTFLKQENSNTFSVRWFAPMAEIELCGHGTLAAAWVANQLFPKEVKFIFNYAAGKLIGVESDGKVELSGTAIISEESAIPDHVKKAFHGKAMAYYPSSNKDLVLFENESDVINMKPDWNALRESDTFGYVITAESTSYDFISRVLLPHINILEDQATGSSHLILTPFWSKRLNKTSMKAYQASERGGQVEVRIKDDLVTLRASCILFGEGSYVGEY